MNLLFSSKFILFNPDFEHSPKLIVVDFEYAAANPAAYDIANHFYEWTADYHGPSPHVLSPSNYPTSFERCNFYSSYIRHAAILAEDPCRDNNDYDKIGGAFSNLMEELDRDVEAWGPASHAGWAIWGIVQAKEDIEGKVVEPEFDYAGYARGRMTAFRSELKRLGLINH
jgi:choline kinase